jgi:hypothetical protein
MIWAQNLLALGNNWAAENQVTIQTTTSTTSRTSSSTTTTTRTSTASTTTTTQVETYKFSDSKSIFQSFSILASMVSCL